jgi:DNA-directed RNA polymerase specialized sigma24 family protein
MPDQTEVKRAIARRKRAEEEYLEALEAYLAEGGTYPELARLLGVSRQAVQQFVSRGRSR